LQRKLPTGFKRAWDEVDQVMIRISTRALQEFKDCEWDQDDVEYSLNGHKRLIEMGWELFPIAEEFLRTFEGSQVSGWIMFGSLPHRESFKLVRDYAKKKGIKLFPIGSYVSVFFISETGAVYEADCDTEYIWKWGDTVAESFDNKFFLRKRTEVTRISDGFGNIVDFEVIKDVHEPKLKSNLQHRLTPSESHLVVIPKTIPHEGSKRPSENPYQFRERTWRKLFKRGWKQEDVNFQPSSLTPVFEEGWEIFPIAEEFLKFFAGSKISDLVEFGVYHPSPLVFRIVKHFAQKNNIKLFPIGSDGLEVFVFISDTGAIYDTCHEARTIGQWGETVEESFDLKVFGAVVDALRISDGNGNFVDF
jgi:hypothetical protein